MRLAWATPMFVFPSFGVLSCLKHAMIEQMAMASGARDVFLDEDLLGGMSVHNVNEKAASHIGSCSRFVLRKHCCGMEKIGVTKVRVAWVTPIFTWPSFGVLN